MRLFVVAGKHSFVVVVVVVVYSSYLSLKCNKKNSLWRSFLHLQRKSATIFFTSDSLQVFREIPRKFKESIDPTRQDKKSSKIHRSNIINH